MVRALTQLLDGHRGTGHRGCTCRVSPVAAAVVASPLDRERGLHVLRGLSHLQKLVIAFPPQQEGHTTKSPAAQEDGGQARGDPGHRLAREQGCGEGLCR